MFRAQAAASAAGQFVAGAVTSIHASTPRGDGSPSRPAPALSPARSTAGQCRPDCRASTSALACRRRPSPAAERHPAPGPGRNQIAEYSLLSSPAGSVEIERRSASSARAASAASGHSSRPGEPGVVSPGAVTGAVDICRHPDRVVLDWFVDGVRFGEPGAAGARRAGRGQDRAAGLPDRVGFGGLPAGAERVAGGGARLRRALGIRATAG